MLTQNPSITGGISEYLHREASLGRMQCLPPESIHKGVHISLIGAIPTKHKPGKWRLIVNLSSPSNASVSMMESVQSGPPLSIQLLITCQPLFFRRAKGPS